jgi:hypothetical protein
VDLPANRAVVRGHNLRREQLIDAVSAAGFRATPS